jgi:LAGLIDADG-like domain
MSECLAWPPRKEDLEKLYLVDKLSAAKIAKVYGLKYKNAKVAESTVLYHLKKNRIKRRDAAEHVRKVTEEMVNGWMSRYQAGESLREIAGRNVDPGTVWNHLKARGIVLRDKLEAQIQAVTKYERKQFIGNDVEKAYLMGLGYGDLDAVRHGRAVRVRVSTTHPAMAELFENLFSPYTHVSRYPRRAKLVGSEWTLECDLENSFEFLLSKPTISELETWNASLFLAFLAGLFDAEGSVLLHKKGERRSPEVALINSDKNLIDFLLSRLGRLGFSAHVYWTKQKEDRNGINGNSNSGRVAICKFDEVLEFLGRVHLRHPERIAKAATVRELASGTSDSHEVFEKWKRLKATIGAARSQFLESAALKIEEKERFLRGSQEQTSRN